MKTSKDVKVSKAIQTSLNKLTTTSSKIRFLNSKGFSRSEIALVLNKRYQHVRNVLITPLTSKK